MLVGCGHVVEEERLSVRDSILQSKVERPDRVDEEDAQIEVNAPNTLNTQPAEKMVTEIIPGWTIPGGDAAQQVGADAPPPGDRLVDASVPSLAIPQFIDVVFGQILQVPYATGPKVSERTDVIQLRSSGEVPADQFLRLISMALEDYGLQVGQEEGLYKVIETASARERRPYFVRARARRSTPVNLRPVVQFVQIKALEPRVLQSLLLQAFPRGSNLQITPDAITGSIILNGLPDDVDAALAIIDALDVLAFADSDVLQFKPTFWQAEPLAQQLSTVLQSEGWQVSTNPGQARPILIIPIAFSNHLLIFLRDERAVKRVQHWLRFLDQPSEMGDVPQLFVYDVRNTDAEAMAATVNEVLGGLTGAGQSGQGAPQAAGGLTQQSGLSAGAGGPIVVDPQGNRLIFSGSPSDFQRLLPLLQRLDSPTPEVLIEVTVVDVDLANTTSLTTGISGDTEDAGDDGSFDVTNALINAASSGGLVFGLTAGDIAASITALASNDRIEVLSTPRIVARSGGSANIQVGDDVPVISSQAPTDFQGTTGASTVLQQVSFRSTGVLLQIEPIVYSNGRVDLTITQEVSTSGANDLTEVANPIISNTSLTTQLTLEDGATAVLGGLIQNNVTRNVLGIPVLKDIPFLGRLFRDETFSVSRSEVLLIITAYILRGPEDRQRFVDYLIDELDSTLAEPVRLRTRIPADYQ